MGDFYSDLKSTLDLRMFWEVLIGVRRNDLLGLAGQLAYFFLLFFFPFLIFLVSLTGLVIGNPEAGLKNLLEISFKSCIRMSMTPALMLLQMSRNPSLKPFAPRIICENDP